MFGFSSPHRTDITVLLDRSGSMSAICEKTVEGFGEFLRKQQETPGDCRLTLAQFDTVYEVVYRQKPLHRVPPLKLVPRGGTALLDAMGKTMLDKARELASPWSAARPSRVMMVIITDGMENSSREFSREQVFAMTRQYQEQQDWQFLYLGANQDAIQVAGQLGINPLAAMTYEAGQRGAANAWQAAASLVSRKRCASVETMCDHGFTAEERSSAAELD